MSFPVGFKDILRKHHCVHYVSARHRKNKQTLRKYWCLGITIRKRREFNTVYIYICIRTFIYLFIGLFIYWFIYIFIYLFIFIYVFNYSFILYVYIYIRVYIYTYLIYIYKLTPAISNQLAVCTSRPLFWCFNHQLFIVEPLILIARFSFSGYI